MFINVNAKNVYVDYGSSDKNDIECLSEDIMINLNQILQLQIESCLISKYIFDQKVILDKKIAFYNYTEDGLWNFMTLYFSKKSYVEFKKLKEKIENY